MIERIHSAMRIMIDPMKFNIIYSKNRWENRKAL